MSYRVVVDSCCDLPDDFRASHPEIVSIPLTIELDGETYIDDSSFPQLEFIQKVAASSDYPRTACPSPQAYLDAYTCDAEDIYVVTLSERLSGSYASAETARQMYLDEYGGKNIFLVNSKSACCGEGLIAMKICELAGNGTSFEEVVSRIETFREEMNTYFVLETLETLRRNGRLSNLTALIVNTLNIKPVMAATPEGEICKRKQARGMDRALDLLASIAVSEVKNPQEKILAITHVNCPERAKKLGEKFRSLNMFKDVVIAAAGGLSTCYANDGGIVVTV
ncbi:MAG: DegV family protein [Lachnospiraceae bacterium]|nr:DegV family protein [Lachnospiraceae bacterium]